MTKDQKYKILLDEFKKRSDRMIDVYDEQLRKRLGGVSHKTVKRLMEDFKKDHDAIEEVPGKRRSTYKLVTQVDLVVETLDHLENVSWVFDMIHEQDPELYKELEKYTSKDKGVFMFKSSPMEDFKRFEDDENFRKLRRLIEAREYVKLTYKHDPSKSFDNLKPLKLVWMDNNWYLAMVDNEDMLRFARLSFIERVDYATKGHTFQPSSVQKHLDFLGSVQNSMTRYDLPWRTATLKASKSIARYFHEHMKKFFPSQRFVRKEKDGSVIFTVDYTQPLEILPFVQKWMPDLIILEPYDLVEKYEKNLEVMLHTIRSQKDTI